MLASSAPISLLLALSLVGAPVPQEPEPELAVQRVWRILPVGYGLETVGDGEEGDGFGLEEVAAEVARRIEASFPGMDVEVGPALLYAAEGDEEAAFDGAEDLDAVDARLGDRVLDRAEADAVLSRYDLVFVFAPWWRGHAGMSHLVHAGRFGDAIHYALVHADPARYVLPFVRGWEELDEPVRRGLEALARLLAPLLELPAVRRTVSADIAVHEFGHFLAPGDRDISDGYDAPWIGHGARDDRPPAEHEPGCVMNKDRTPANIVRKVAALLLDPARSRFCPRCVELVAPGAPAERPGPCPFDP